jgi:xanthine dehydrogenase YagT iron-sulfur-binding subunit
VNGRRILSCLTLAVMQQGKEITTIEGLAATAGATGDALHPMQQAFNRPRRLPVRLLHVGPDHVGERSGARAMGSSDDDVREAMSGNICRCGAYPGIVAAIQQVRKETPTGSNGGRR